MTPHLEDFFVLVLDIQEESFEKFRKDTAQTLEAKYPGYNPQYVRQNSLANCLTFLKTHSFQTWLVGINPAIYQKANNQGINQKLLKETEIQLEQATDLGTAIIYYGTPKDAAALSRAFGEKDTHRIYSTESSKEDEIGETFIKQRALESNYPINPSDSLISQIVRELDKALSMRKSDGTSNLRIDLVRLQEQQISQGKYLAALMGELRDRVEENKDGLEVIRHTLFTSSTQTQSPSIMALLESIQREQRAFSADMEAFMKTQTTQVREIGVIKGKVHETEARLEDLETLKKSIEGKMSSLMWKVALATVSGIITVLLGFLGVAGNNFFEIFKLMDE